MSSFIRFMQAIIAVLTGLPLIFSSVLQCVTGTGYNSKSADEISANYLVGSESFIDEAVSENWSVGYGRSVLTPDDVNDYRYFLADFSSFRHRKQQA